MSQTRSGRRYALDEPGWALKHSARRQKHLSAALGIDQPRVSRKIRGEIACEVRSFYEVVRNLTLSAHTDAGHTISGAIEACEEVAATDLTRDEIRARLYHAHAEETRAQAAEDRAQHRVAVEVGRTHAENASPDDFAELSAALLEWEHASRDEMGWSTTVLIYGRALRKEVDR